MSRSPSVPASPRPAVETLEGRCVPTTAQFVTNLYSDLLNRVPSAGEASFWINSLNSGLASPVNVAVGFLNSNEFLNRETVEYYQNFLNRTPSAADANFWVNVRRQGVTSRQQAVQFLASPEFYGLQGSTPRAWISGLFNEVLARSPDTIEINNLLTFGLQDYFGRLNAAALVTFSAESNARAVDAAFDRILERDPDPFGLNFWTARLNAGLDTTALLAVLAASSEYVNVKSGGLDRPLTIPQTGQPAGVSISSQPVRTTTALTRVTTPIPNLPPGALNTFLFTSRFVPGIGTDTPGVGTFVTTPAPVATTFFV